MGWSSRSAVSTLSRSLGAGSGGVLSGRAWAGFSSEPLAHRGQQVAADGERPVVRIGRRHDDPRRLRGRGLAHEGLADLDEAVVLLEVRPFGLGHAPARAPGPSRATSAACFCWSLDRWNQYFSSSTPSSHSIFSRRWISPMASGELAVVDLAHDALDDRHRVPGAEEDADLPLGRQRAPEAPVCGALGLFVRRRTEGGGLDVAGIHPLVEQVDGLALAGAFDARDQDQHREAAVEP